MTIYNIHVFIRFVNGYINKQHHRAASIPKFGSWDVNDPKSGEGFTVIFDRIKEEKQNNGAIEVPTMLPPRPPTNHLKDRSKRSCVSKVSCTYT